MAGISDHGVNEPDDVDDPDAWLAEWGDLFPDDDADQDSTGERGVGADDDDGSARSDAGTVGTRPQAGPAGSAPDAETTRPLPAGALQGPAKITAPLPAGPGDPDRSTPSSRADGTGDAPSADDETSLFPAGGSARTSALPDPAPPATPGPTPSPTPAAGDSRRDEPITLDPVDEPQQGTARPGEQRPPAQQARRTAEQRPPAQQARRTAEQRPPAQQARRTGELQAQALARMTDEHLIDGGRRGPKGERGRGEGGLAAWGEAQERAKRQARLRANQRTAQAYRQQQGAATTGQLDFRRGSGRSPDPRVALAMGVVSVLAAIGLVTYLLTRAQGAPGDDAAGPAGPVLATATQVQPATNNELALSTVRLVGLDDNGATRCAGSGVIVDGDGLILTNAHVVAADGDCPLTSIGVSVLDDDVSVEPELAYRAEVMAFDPELDLAVLRIEGYLDPEDDREPPYPFRSAPLGNSETLRLGDELRIFGYPAIGGETVTLTRGSVAGFTSQRAVGRRALIKTDASISAGNSGGMAADENGVVIGIPTRARAAENGPAIDCRLLDDTNGDGTVDRDDNCVSVGGFLNGIRPIKLAEPLIDQARDASEPLGPMLEQSQLSAGFNVSAVRLTKPRFSLEVRSDEPIDEVQTVTAGVERLCFFADWEGIPDGTVYDGLWFRDGDLVESASHPNATWKFGEKGTNFWVCIEDTERGLKAGQYELGFFVESQLIFVEGIVLTEEPAETHPITWVNETGADVCGLAINPLTTSIQVGLNELDPGQTIPVDGSVTLDLAAGTIIAEAYDCDGRAVADEFGGLNIDGPGSLFIGVQNRTGDSG